MKNREWRSRKRVLGPKLETRSSCRLLPKETFISNQPLPELLVTVSSPKSDVHAQKHLSLFPARRQWGEKTSKPSQIKNEAEHIYHCHTACVRPIKLGAAVSLTARRP